jgi:hypothetical protein
MRLDRRGEGLSQSVSRAESFSPLINTKHTFPFQVAVGQYSTHCTWVHMQLGRQWSGSLRRQSEIINDFKLEGGSWRVSRRQRRQERPLPRAERV